MSQSRKIMRSHVAVLKPLDQPPRQRFPNNLLVLTLLVINAVAAIITLVSLTVEALGVSEPHLSTLLSSL